MMPCPAPADWLRLVDGQLVEDRATELRSHAAGCSQCALRLRSTEHLTRRLAAPVDGLPQTLTADTRAQVLRRINALRPSPAAATGVPQRWFAFCGLAAAAAVAALYLRPAAPEFEARGHVSEHTLSRDVGISLFTGGGSPHRLVAGQAITRDTPIVTTARNISKQSAYLLELAVDSSGRVHWIEPAADATAAFSVPPHPGDSPLPETVVLDEPAAGPLRVITIVSATPIAPSALGTELTPAALSRRFPGSVVDELPLTILP